MRKIEEQMNNAIKARRPFHCGNTIVKEGVFGSLDVELHGNTIATIYTDNTIVLDSCGWRTNTTKSRLNAILHGLGLNGITQRNHEWFLIDPTTGESKKFHDRIVLNF